MVKRRKRRKKRRKRIKKRKVTHIRVCTSMLACKMFSNEERRNKEKE